MNASSSFCSAENSYEQCGGDSGFWGGSGGGGFGDGYAFFNRNFGGVPAAAVEGYGQYQLDLQIQRFQNWLPSDAAYIGDFSWANDNGTYSFSPNHGWDAYFNRERGTFWIPPEYRSGSQAGLNMAPEIDPVMIGAGMLSGLLRVGAEVGVAAAVAESVEIKI